MVSLDGFFEGSNKEIDWHTVDSEFNAYAIDFLQHLDTLLFGRVTYELMASYWPSQDALSDDPIVANLMNSIQKVVVSNSLKKAEWNNTQLIKENIVEEIRKLKNQKGKDIAIFGSSDLALSLIEADLIDEFRIIISPTVIGEGKSLFAGIGHRLHFKLTKSQTFSSGNVLLHYERKVN